MERIIFDCDPGHDDAIALVMAFASEKLDIRAVTTVAGNQTLDKTSVNASRMLTALGVSPLLAKGASKPMHRKLQTAPIVHGETGLDGPVLPPPSVPFSERHAWDVMRDILLEERTTILATGPLTNLGILLSAYPEVKDRIDRIVLMGGGLDHGNWTATAEFNILVDPEAADIVFSSGIPIVMCGLDVTEKAMIYSDEIERLRESGRIGKLVAELLDFFSIYIYSLGFPGITLHDPVAAAYLVKPELFKGEDLFVGIETQGKATLGMTYADKRITPKREAANAKVIMDLDREGFIELLMKACLSYQE